jgi:hypothetical protein
MLGDEDDINSEQTVDEENAFWVSQSNADATEFRVLWDGSEVARCHTITNDTNEQTCDVYFPQQD